ncbi:adenylate/guanylate cyclase domain-containing protein [Gordonia sp. CPCC 205515]|uniref:adenylate/guanylate cyclase domain-containing protein n=1 Tax=Gordonia sp. CPCC 205515 TaxID=3140791 RepID=UPI003AF3974C
MSTTRTGRDYGSILLGRADESPRRRRVRIQTLLTVCIVVANLFGVAIAILLATVGIPEPSVLQPELWWINYIAVPVYVVAAFALGIALGTVVALRDLRWSIQQRIPTRDDARRAQRAPRRLVAIQGVLWAIATVMFTIMYGVMDPNLIPKVLFVVGLSGVVVVTASDLLIEFAMRPVQAEVISAGYRRRQRTGILSRAVVSWIAGSAVPIIGIILVVFFGVLRDDTTKLDLFIGVTVLAVIAISTGLILCVLSTTSVNAAIRSVRGGMRSVQSGDTDVDLVVYDGTEVGDLQVGFNSMVAGLREREHLHDLFGRHVGRDVADAAMQRDPELGGTERTVAVVFVDVIGSTTLAADRSPVEVVDILNRFFAVIVDAVERHRGLVNKFEGDAVLAIFGAPIDLDDPAGAALSAAREVATGLAADVPDLRAGIGVGYGPVVAGNVGAIERFEYTVIGDPVNESARLSELAKRDPSRPLASGRAIDAAGDEAAQWERQETTTLRGRTVETTVYAADLTHSSTRSI